MLSLVNLKVRKNKDSLATFPHSRDTDYSGRLGLKIKILHCASSNIVVISHSVYSPRVEQGLLNNTSEMHAVANSNFTTTDATSLREL